MIVYTRLLLMTLRLILSCFFVVTTTQEVSPVQTNVGSDANFSFMLTENPNTMFVTIRNKAGGFVMAAFGSVGVSKDPYHKDIVNFTGNTNQKQISFILRNVTLLDAGIYTAVFENSNVTIGSQMLIVKAVPCKPKIVELEGHAINRTNYHLICSAQSNSQPPNYNLTMFSEWRKDDMLINSSGRYIVNGTELTITGVSYKDNGYKLSCVAFEDQVSKSLNSDKLIMVVKCTQRNQINAKSVRHDAADGQDYEGLHINNTEASPYLQLNDITLEENKNAKSRPPENDSYEKLHPYTNSDIQMYSSLKIPKISKGNEKVYQNTQIKATNFNC